MKVALRKESVDRNVILAKQLDRPAPSLSARRAWIEIALLNAQNRDLASLSARRAWIEITYHRGTLRELRGRSPQGERG